MRTRGLIVAAALLAVLTAPGEAQRTRDEARIVFTVSGAHISGRGLWSVASQPVQQGPFSDNFALARSIRPTLGAGFSGAYFAGEHVGLSADFVLLGLGYEDACRIVGTASSAQNVRVCETINEQARSAAAVTVSVGGNFRFFSREFISPFARANVGLLFSNQSPILTQGVDQEGVLLTVYDDDRRTRVTPAFAIGVGATAAISRGYHVRWEVRDNIVGIDAVTGPTAGPRVEPPHERQYKHMFSVLIGIDVVLERSRGRRY